LTLSSTWIASSRVGVRISARIGCLAGEVPVLANGSRRWISGSANAAVLPVPVCAAPRMSPPLQGQGDHLLLDRCRRGVAHFVEGTQDVGRQPEFSKSRQSLSSEISGSVRFDQAPGRPGRVGTP